MIVIASMCTELKMTCTVVTLQHIKKSCEKNARNTRKTQDILRNNEVCENFKKNVKILFFRDCFQYTLSKKKKNDFFDIF